MQQIYGVPGVMKTSECTFR